MVNIHADQISLWATRMLRLSVMVVVAACAAPNAALQQAQQTYAQARQDPEIATNAPLALHEAEQALRQAEQAQDEEEVNHLAYLASRRVEIARAEGQRKKAEGEAERRLKERDKVVLDARTHEAKEAQARAQQSERVAQGAEAKAQQLTQELAELQAKKTDRGFVLTLGDVLFDYNRASLKPGAQQHLYRLVTFLKEHPDQKVLIEGHTDSMGSESYNLDLSQRRAQGVQAFLLGNGIDSERTTARGQGKAYPIASNDTAAGRQQNRRVEIVFLEPPLSRR